MISVRRAGCLGLLLCVSSLTALPAMAQVRMRAGKGIAAKKAPGRAGPPAGSRLDMLERMTPEQQERFLNSLPEQRRAQAREMLGKWRDMSPEEKSRARQSLGEFSGLAPDRQRRIRILYGEFNGMPADRQPVLRDELKELRAMERPARVTRFTSKEFRRKYSVDERRVLRELSNLLPALDAAEPEGAEQQDQDE